MKDCLLCILLKETQGSKFLKKLGTSSAFLSIDQRFRGWSFVVYNKHVTDPLDLPKKEFDRFIADMKKVAAALKKTLKPDKINYALLGDAMEHMHWHVIPRYKDDGYWGKPPFGLQEKILEEKEYRELATKIRKNL